MNGRRNWIWALALVGAGVLAAAPAAALTIDFDTDGSGVDIVHGQVIDVEYQPTFGITTSANNVGGGPNLAIAFDTALNPPPNPLLDPDLVGPPAANWDSGNIPLNTILGNILVIQENNTGCVSGVCTNPDDEGTRPAGSMFFKFATPITSFGFDLVDVEGPLDPGGAEFDASSGFFAAFFTEGGLLIGDEVGFGSFVASDGAMFGNNSANRISPIVIADLVGPVTASSASFVEINMRGSGGVDNIVYTEVPEPGTLTILGLGLATLALMGFRRRRRCPAR